MGILKIIICLVLVVEYLGIAWADVGLISPTQLKPFVDEIAEIPAIKGFDVVNGCHVPKSLNIGMFSIDWKFHRDLPPTRVFAYGLSKTDATVPGPTIEAQYNISTYIQWENYLPSEHILPLDHTIPMATPPNGTGIPTVVHLHGGIGDPESDGHAMAWFTSGFRHRGSSWTKTTYHYPNVQQLGGALWYHDHAMGLTRVNLLAGLVGAYVIRHPEVELPLGLPYGDEFDRPLVVFDRAFLTNGSLFMNSTGNNPSIHPQWQPEYFGDAIIVNGKAWPYMTVKRRKYRFRIINAANARFFRFYFNNTLTFIHVASDSAYNKKPVEIKELLLAPSEIADVIVDFSNSTSDSVILRNDAPYPFPSGDPVNEANRNIMKFVIRNGNELDKSRIHRTLIEYPSPDVSTASVTRYIALYEYTSKIDEPTHLYINGMSFEDPVTETPKAGSTEIWNVINLTEDNHPLHIHLGLFVALDQTELLDVDNFRECMLKNNNATECHMEKHARGKKEEVSAHEKGWKNVYKMMPGYVTKILVKFSYIHTNESYPFDATKEPGYVYHCHILDHEDNAMMRPLKFTH
ncbi:multicopper oxidase lpr1 [Phtheirospermum japonicum]|uniref:Multicopper oxidase lpr1 n=1 Tax=Phtheirospermum japonicum TaxID=374723 RepID=A0A830D3V9_9LAMI|nr:multicopper oxidase lpr1 [Phtheirospermum japonicum]